jgi:hypothetical protein
MLKFGFVGAGAFASAENVSACSKLTDEDDSMVDFVKLLKPKPIIVTLKSVAINLVFFFILAFLNCEQKPFIDNLLLGIPLLVY